MECEIQFRCSFGTGYARRQWRVEGTVTNKWWVWWYRYPYLWAPLPWILANSDRLPWRIPNREYRLLLHFLWKKKLLGNIDEQYCLKNWLPLHSSWSSIPISSTRRFLLALCSYFSRRSKSRLCRCSFYIYFHILVFAFIEVISEIYIPPCQDPVCLSETAASLAGSHLILSQIVVSF